MTHPIKVSSRIRSFPSHGPALAFLVLHEHDHLGHGSGSTVDLGGRRLPDTRGERRAINLVGGDELVPHTQLFDAMAQSDFGLISYRLSKHIENSIPTKLYEYLGCQLPILLQDYAPWKEICKPYQAAIVLNYSMPDIDLILLQIKKSKFYSNLPEDVTWATEEPKLLKAIAALF